jgi:MoaA/NifB/PqqE/SkfB family radical SAM enzyme
MAYTRHALDGAVLYFDRDSGVNHLVRGESTRDSSRVAPRSLQIGLSAACNLACSFCYRDKQAQSRLTPDFLVPLLKDAADWGVLEVAFGGGEPLLYPHFPELLHELKQRGAIKLT